ncbi:MAG: hypothetical protein IPO90_14255 [Flavobacteriales bacterium]|nr:hypothetical protein [Flavobacteriales bacterium]
MRYTKLIPPLALLFAVLQTSAQPGAIDLSYGDNGWAIVPPPDGLCDGRAIALAADGSSYVVADCSSNPDIKVVHFTVDGGLDMSYGVNGFASVDVPNATMDDEARSAVVQPDGKLLIGGSTYSFGVGDEFTLVRLLPDGTLDSGFGTNGITRLHISNNDDQANGLLLLSTGKILMYGFSEASGYRPSVARLNSDGTFDTSFNGVGYNNFLVPGLLTGKVNDAIELPDGRVVLCGERSSNIDVRAFAVAFLTSGTIDPNFPAQTYIIGDGTWLRGNGLDDLPDGRIVITGNLENGDGELFGLRTTPTGAVDSTYGVNGFFRTNTVWEAEGYDVQCSADGSSRLIGWGKGPDTAGVYVVKHLTNGQLDPSYASGGIGIYHRADYDMAFASVVQGNGKLLVAGASAFDMMALRIEDDLATSINSTPAADRPGLDVRYDPASQSYLLFLPSKARASTLSITDLAGRTIRKVITNGETPLRLSVSDMTPGLYLLSTVVEGSALSARLLVAH